MNSLSGATKSGPFPSVARIRFGQTRTFALTLVLALVPALAASEADDEAARTKEGLETFRDYLKKEFPAKKWQAGPTRLDSSALRTAYGRQRFYFVYSSPSLPPGAAIVQEAYRREVEEFVANYVSLAVRIDEKGRVEPVSKPQDYNAGLMKIGSDKDARTAAAAILSLHLCDHVGPATVDPEDIALTSSDKGWSCRHKGKDVFAGTVTFDAGGKCTAVSKFYSGPRKP